MIKQEELKRAQKEQAKEEHLCSENERQKEKVEEEDLERTSVNKENILVTGFAPSVPQNHEAAAKDAHGNLVSPSAFFVITPESATKNPCTNDTTVSDVSTHTAPIQSVAGKSENFTTFTNTFAQSCVVRPESLSKKCFGEPGSSVSASVTPSKFASGSSFEEFPNTKDVKGSQTVPTFMSLLETENYFLKFQTEEVKNRLEKLRTQFSLDHVKVDDDLVCFYTGFLFRKLLETFLDIFKTVKVNYYLDWKVEKLSRHDQIFMTLIKLRLNCPDADLALRFNCSMDTVTNVFVTWVHVIHEIIFEGLMREIPSRHKNRLTLPFAFINFPNCRIVLDCMEISVEPPKSLDKQMKLFSPSKRRHTFKGLIGVAPNGTVTFTSSLYPGSTSNEAIVSHSGILQKLVPGDLVLAGKEFLISDILPAGVTLKTPPLRLTPQPEPPQVKQAERVAGAHIQVERAINRIECYKILDLMPESLFPHATKIWQVCAALTNFLPVMSN